MGPGPLPFPRFTKCCNFHGTHCRSCTAQRMRQKTPFLGIHTSRSLPDHILNLSPEHANDFALQGCITQGAARKPLHVENDNLVSLAVSGV